MTLAFSTQLNGKPTYFIEKIWSCIYDHQPLIINSEFPKYREQIRNRYSDSFSPRRGVPKPKKHTIRRDKTNKWKPGKEIECVINQGDLKELQFAPVLKCISVQIIEIIHSAEQWRQPWVIIDGKLLIGTQIDQLAINDGFNNTKEFFEYFSEDFKGKIIHWTNLKY